jgi:hypothetical protein
LVLAAFFPLEALELGVAAGGADEEAVETAAAVEAAEAAVAVLAFAPFLPPPALAFAAWVVAVVVAAEVATALFEAVAAPPPFLPLPVALPPAAALEGEDAAATVWPLRICCNTCVLMVAEMTTPLASVFCVTGLVASPKIV